MKSQHIAVIFIIIILPIAMVMSYTIGKQMDTLKLQNDYNLSLTNATYDAVKAFQINTVNNRYSSISASKIRDIEASINTFFNSLSDNEPLNKEQLKTYVPALVYTLYDGYYIYSKYDNVYPTNNGQPILDETELQKYDANYGLKPYIYYSCRYRTPNGTKDFVVNYTLDNAITVYGNLGNGYETKSGYLIAPELVEVNSYNENNPLGWKLTYDGVTIIPEELTEHLLFADETNGDYNYIVYNGQKIYYDKEVQRTEKTTEYFYYQDYAKSYIPNYDTNKELINYLAKRTNNGKLFSTSSFEYYYNAKQFSQYIIDNIGNIKQSDAVELDENNNFVSIDFSLKTGDEKIFNVSKTNDPLLSNSTFDENRKSVIRKSIETNLTAAIANYNMYTTNTYEFKLPVLNEIEWEKITNNVSIISFLQGIPIGYKYYNNYCVITNNDNEEVVKKENIYIITQEDDGTREYHLPGCTHLLEMTKVITTSRTLKNINVFNTSDNLLTQQKLEIIGDNSALTGETKILTVKLSTDELIGVVSGKIAKTNNISNIELTGQNGWKLTYNKDTGTFNIYKEDGAKEGDLLQITYTAGNEEGTGKITLTNLKLTNLQYQTTTNENVEKEIQITNPKAPDQITIIGDSSAYTGETKTLDVKLSSSETIGVISGIITANELISNVEITGKNGWEITQNPLTGNFRAIKPEGATEEVIFTITYKAGNNTGTAKVTLSNLNLANLQYQNKSHDNVTKNITIKKDNGEYEIVKRYTIAGAYDNISFLRQTVRISEGNYLYFYPLTRVENPFLTTCYYCMVNANSSYDVEGIIKGEIIMAEEDGRQIKINSSNNINFKNIREAYIRALGRERNHLYQVNIDSFNQ